jgi:hypothetical protein
MTHFAELLGLCEPVCSSKLVAFLINVHHVSINSPHYPVIVNTLRLPKFSVPLVFTDKCHCVYYFSHTYHELAHYMKFICLP